MVEVVSLAPSEVSYLKLSPPFSQPKSISDPTSESSTFSPTYKYWCFVPSHDAIRSDCIPSLVVDIQTTSRKFTGFKWKLF